MPSSRRPVRRGQSAAAAQSSERHPRSAGPAGVKTEMTERHGADINWRESSRATGTTCCSPLSENVAEFRQRVFRAACAPPSSPSAIASTVRFFRPFFLSPEDEQRVRVVAETIADLGERVVSAALVDAGLFGQLHLRPEEERLARLSRRIRPRQHVLSPRRVPAARLAEICRVQRRSACRRRLLRNARRSVSRTSR